MSGLLLSTGTPWTRLLFSTVPLCSNVTVQQSLLGLHHMLLSFVTSLQSFLEHTLKPQLLVSERSGCIIMVQWPRKEKEVQAGRQEPKWQPPQVTYHPKGKSRPISNSGNLGSLGSLSPSSLAGLC